MFFSFSHFMNNFFYLVRNFMRIFSSFKNKIIIIPHGIKYNISFVEKRIKK